MRQFKSFIYRRLAPLVTCSIRIRSGYVDLYDKYQVASFQDVFTDPNYWRVFNLFQEPPKLIVDCGAHCGHFAILTDLCLQARFGNSSTFYILIEPDRRLQSSIVRNLTSAGLEGRFEVVSGAVGCKSGDAQLVTHSKNLLVSTLRAPESRKLGRVYRTEYVDISRIVEGKKIDLLKIDVEGSEFEFFQFNEDVVSQTDRIMIEIHGNYGNPDSLKSKILDSGFESLQPELRSDGNLYAIFQRSTD